jgi:RNA polymerase sigma factor (sigma-70 family)
MDENKIITDNIAMVKKIARYFKPPNTTEYEEYVHNGTIGLLKAIRTYDPTRAKFSTHAWNNIYWEISRYIKGNKKIKSTKPVTQEQLTEDIAEYNLDDGILEALPDNLSDEEFNIIQLMVEGYNLTDISVRLKLKKHEIYNKYRVMLRKIRISNEEKNTSV